MEDPLKRLNLRWAIETLTGEHVPASGVMRCVLPDHDDSRPSFKLYANDSWVCFGCGRGGTLIDLAAALRGVEPRGRAYFELRDWLLERLDGVSEHG